MTSPITRQELIDLVNKSFAMPPLVKAMAGFYLMLIPEEKVVEIGGLVQQASEAIDRGDWATVEKLAKETGLPEEYIQHARNVLSAAKQDHAPGQ